MVKKIPPNYMLKLLIKEAVKERKIIHSQVDLAKIVLRKLRKKDKGYVVSPFRVKRLALEIPQIEVKIKTKRVPKPKRIRKCPVCQSKVRPVKIKNLVGKMVTVAYKCEKCGFEGTKESFLPYEYIFIWKG